MSRSRHPRPNFSTRSPHSRPGLARFNSGFPFSRPLSTIGALMETRCSAGWRSTAASVPGAPCSPSAKPIPCSAVRGGPAACAFFPGCSALFADAATSRESNWSFRFVPNPANSKSGPSGARVLRRVATFRHRGRGGLTSAARCCTPGSSAAGRPSCRSGQPPYLPARLRQRGHACSGCGHGTRLLRSSRRGSRRLRLAVREWI